MKTIYLFEAESVNKYRENIIKERLVYIKYLMDNTNDKKEVSRLEKIYNCLYNINYDSNGKLRTLNGMFTYINQTMTENKGLIPDLPTNDQIQTIDEKAAAFKKLHEVEFNAYLTRFEKVNIDKADNNQKSDDAKSVLSPENPEDNKKALSKIREISSIFGLTNIIGLEPKRQPSSKDMENQKELKLQQKTGDPLANPEDNEEETKQIDKEKSNPDPEQQSSGEDATPKPEDGSNNDKSKQELQSFIGSTVEAYMESIDDPSEYSPENFKKWCEDNDISNLKMDEKTQNIFYELCNKAIKATIDKEDEGVDDDMDQAADEFDDSLDGSDEQHESYIPVILNMIVEDGATKVAAGAGAAAAAAGIGSKVAQIGMANKLAAINSATKLGYNPAMVDFFGAHAGPAAQFASSGLGQTLLASGPQLMAIAGGIAAIAATVALVRHAKRKRTEKMTAGLKKQIESEKDPKRKAELQKNYDNMMKACYDKNGKPRPHPKMKDIPKEDRKAFKDSYNEMRKDKTLKNVGKSYLKNGGKDALKQDLAKIDKISKKDRKNAEKAETTVKDKDGSEIIARKKKNGSGSTYVRKKNGKEIGYATRDEFQAAKKAAKESLSRKSLSDYLLESLQ